jgi:hypothetical protein
LASNLCASGTIDAGRAKAAIDYLRMLDDKMIGERGVKRRTCIDRAINVYDVVTRPAYKVMMVAGCVRLIEHRPAIDGQPPQQAGPGQMREAVVNCLVRHVGQHGGDVRQDARGADVRPAVHGFEHRDPLARDPQTGFANGRTRIHLTKLILFLNRSRL